MLPAEEAWRISGEGLFTGVPRRVILRTSQARSSRKFIRGRVESANAHLAALSTRPGDRGTRLLVAACAADRRAGPEPRCARAFQAAPPCGQGTQPPAGTCPPGRAGAFSGNPRSFAFSKWPIAGIIVPRLSPRLPLYGVLGSSPTNLVPWRTYISLGQ